MEQVRSQVFTFTWRIENFSMCPQQMKEWIESPSFVVDFLENTKWKLRIYPRGNTDQNYVSVYLERAEDCAYAQEIQVAYTLIALSTYDGKNVEHDMLNRTIEPNDSWGYLKFGAREEIFKHESGLLPNDTLTLRCQLSRRVQEQETNGAPSVEELKTDCWKCNPPSEKYDCSARTRVQVSSTSFMWPIKRICEFPCDVKLSKSMPAIMENEPSFDFSLFLKKDSKENTRIEIRRKNLNEEGFFVRCHIRTVGAPRSVQFEGRDEHYFKEGEQDAWIFPTFLKMNDLKESYFKHTDGALYLQIDLSFSRQDDLLHIESISETRPHDFVSERERPCAPTRNLEKLYMDGELVDATLRVEDREFKVHKLILSAESDVFRKMFDSGMKEEHSGVVDIADFDADTVERLLKYMYTHQLAKLNPEDAIKLYSAADKYNVEDLKCRLRSDLTASLSVDTVCETLLLADLHHDEDLLESVFDYVSKNNTEIFHSHNWKDFVKTHGVLAATIMLRFFVRK